MMDHPVVVDISVRRGGGTGAHKFRITLLLLLNVAPAPHVVPVSHGGGGGGGVAVAGMILNSVRAKSAKVCPEASLSHFPLPLPLESRPRSQPTHIDITHFFPYALLVLPSFLLSLA